MMINFKKDILMQLILIQHTRMLRKEKLIYLLFTVTRGEVYEN